MIESIIPVLSKSVFILFSSLVPYSKTDLGYTKVDEEIIWYIKPNINSANAYDVTIDLTKVKFYVYTNFKFIVEFNDIHGKMVKRDTLNFNYINTALNISNIPLEEGFLSGKVLKKTYKYNYGENVKVNPVKLLYVKHPLGTIANIKIPKAEFTCELMGWNKSNSEIYQNLSFFTLDSNNHFFDANYSNNFCLLPGKVGFCLPISDPSAWKLNY